MTQPGSQHIQVRECRISDALGSGIYMSYGTTEGQAPVHCSLVANNIDSVGLAGITALGKHLLVNSNVINASGNQSPHADLITFYDHTNEDIVVAGNSLFNSWNNGIHGGGNRLNISGYTVETVIDGQGIVVQGDKKFILL